jgi:hypothetical protein
MKSILTKPRYPAWMACSVLTLVSACTGLLPVGETRVGVGWTDFEHAREPFEIIYAYQSTRADVHLMGLDPFKNPSVTMLANSDVLQRIGTGNILRSDQLDRGVREYMEIGKR